jgi:hypothetical protein
MVKDGQRKLGDRLAKTAREGWLGHATGFAPTRDGQSMMHTTIGPDKYGEKVASAWEPALDDAGRKIGEIRPAEAQPSLYDQVMAILKKTNLRRWRRWDQQVVAKRDIDVGARLLRQAMMRALRYELTDDAWLATQVFSLEHMDAMVSGMRWLRPLSPEVWVEFSVDAKDLNKAQSHFGTVLNNIDPPPEKYIPARVGYLISQEGDSSAMFVRVVTLGKNNTIVNLPLIGAYIFPDKTRYPGRTYYGGFESHRLEVLRWTVGVSLHEHQKDDHAQPPNQLLEHFDIGVIGKRPGPDQVTLYDQRVVEALENHCGLARRAAGILFLLTHRRLVAARLHEGQVAVGMAHDLPYWGHSTIGIRLPREKAIGSLVRFAKRSNRPPLRGHDVEGHWCWSHQTDLGCAHDWHADDWDDAGTERRYRCAKCSGARWFRKKHERGDASLGWVHQKRVVTTRTKATSGRHRDCGAGGSRIPSLDSNHSEA